MSNPALKIVRIEGQIANFAILPWEEPAEYHALLQATIDEYKPRGPVQQHLVEEVASILWRMRRVGLAESALYRKGLDVASERSGQVIGRALAHTSVPGRLLGDLAREGHFTNALIATSEETRDELRDIGHYQAATQRALDILVSADLDTYPKALDTLPAETRGWWQDALSGEWQDAYQDEGENAYSADAEGLGRFLEAKALPWYEAQIAALQNRPMIAAQAYGEAADPERLMILARYETHLDRKLERCLAFLARERETRAP